MKNEKEKIKNRFFTKARILKNWHIKISCLILAIILWAVCRFNNLSERYFSVPLQVFQSNISVPNVSLPPMVRVHLRGEPNSLFPIQESDVEPYVDLSSYTTEGTYQVPVLYLLKGTALDVDPLEVIIEPTDISVVMEHRVTKQVSVTPSFRGYPEKGYEFSGYQTNPSVVEITGPKSKIQAINDIGTKIIDVSGRNAEFSTTVQYSVPDKLVNVHGVDSVFVTVNIQETISSKKVEDVVYDLRQVPRGLILNSNFEECAVEVKGPQKILDELVLDSSNIYVLCGSIKSPGSYTISLQANLPKEVEVVSITPSEVIITAESVNYNGILHDEE